MNERIEAVRKAQGLTQEQFAEKINLSRNYLWMLENGSRVPSDRTIKDICDKFGVCEEWLRTGEGEMTATDAQSDKIATFLADLTRDDDNNFKKRFVEMLADLQPKDWELLERLAEKLTQKKSTRRCSETRCVSRSGGLRISTQAAACENLLSQAVV